MNTIRMIQCLVILLCGGGMAVGQVEGRSELPEVPSLVVTGRGMLQLPPDQAVVRLGAVAQAKNAADAQEQVNRVMQRAIRAVRELDIPPKAIRTVGVSLTPVHGRERPGEVPFRPDIIGYRASNTLQVELDAVGRLGEVIDAGIEAGVNQIESVTFGLRDDLDGRKRALTLALREAREKARAMTDAIEANLGEVLEIIEGGTPDFRPMQMHRGLAMDMATPIEPGELRVEATVTVRYRIER